MFNENFSFRSSSRDVAPPPLTVDDYTSSEISPLNSRPTSPRYLEASSKQRQPSLLRRDSRFDYPYRPARHPSVTALTAQLEHHAIAVDNSISRPDSPISMASPGGSITDQDEGFFDGPDTPLTNYSEDGEFDPTMWDLQNMGATSSPRPSLSLEAQAFSSYTHRRRQRQVLVRLQCLAQRAPDIAMLIEECHPSSLPLNGDYPYTSKSRSNSTAGLLGGTSNPGRIEKMTSTSACVRKQVKMRKRATR